MVYYLHTKFNKAVYKLLAVLFLISSGEDSQAMGTVDWGMESPDTQIRTRPLTQEDYDFWFDLQASPAATALFRDGLPRLPEAVTPQADRSLQRLEQGDPRFIHVVELKTEELGWRKAGTIVLGGSERPNYFEIAGLSHPAILKNTGDYLREIDVEALKRGEPGFEMTDSYLIPIWGQQYATTTLKMMLENHLPKARQVVREDFNGPEYKGIIATSSNPASEKLLEHFGFGRSESMEMSRFGVAKWTYTLEFTD